MDEVKVTGNGPDFHDQRNERRKVFDPAFPTFVVQLPQRLQTYLKSRFKQSRSEEEAKSPGLVLPKGKGSPTALEVDVEKQLQSWKENPTWVDQTPEIKVTVPKGSLCNLNAKFKVGLPPDAVYDIVTDPDNKRVFKNIKEVISRKVLVDEGLRQLVEVEQAALWRFLWWSGTISVHVMVDQNRKDHTMKFKQVKTGFMKRFEGCWRVEPLLVDEDSCYPSTPTGGKGRVGSMVTLDQLIQPALVPPPPISWYLRGITTRTTAMLVTDLLAETARIRGGSDIANSSPDARSQGTAQECSVEEASDIKERWYRRRRSTRRRLRRIDRAMKPSPL